MTAHLIFLLSESCHRLWRGSCPSTEELKWEDRLVLLRPHGRDVPGQHEDHEVRSSVLGLVSQEGTLSLMAGTGRRWNTSYFSQSYSRSSDLISAKGNQSQISHFVDAGGGLWHYRFTTDEECICSAKCWCPNCGCRPQKKGCCCGEEKNKETSPMLQRGRKLNEPFTSSLFSSGEVVKLFYISSPSPPLVHGEKKKEIIN